MSMTPLADVVDLSLLLVAASKEAGVEYAQAGKLLDALISLPNYAAERIIAERRYAINRRSFMKTMRSGR